MGEPCTAGYMCQTVFLSESCVTEGVCVKAEDFECLDGGHLSTLESCQTILVCNPRF
jgi:hypothetical protein